jgi:hypothetical protein
MQQAHRPMHKQIAKRNAITFFICSHPFFLQKYKVRQPKPAHQNANSDFANPMAILFLLLY